MEQLGVWRGHVPGHTVIFYGNMYCSILLSYTSVSTATWPYVSAFHLPGTAQAHLCLANMWTGVDNGFLVHAIFHSEAGVLSCPAGHQHLPRCPQHRSVLAFQLYYFISMAFFGFLIPFLVIVYCYMAIIWTLNAKDRRWLWYIRRVSSLLWFSPFLCSALISSLLFIMPTTTTATPMPYTLSIS